MNARALFFPLLAMLGCGAPALRVADTADLIVHNAKILTVDGNFSIHEAMAVREGRILALGPDQEVFRAHGAGTRVVDLDGMTVIPGLIDSHVHSTGASMYEFDHEVPYMEKIQDVLDYVAARAKVVSKGEWIVLQQVFITRLRERRYPTREELDRVAPDHPVIFRTGPDASLNSAALEKSAITKDSKDRKSGKIEKDPGTGEPTGILRGWRHFVKFSSPGKRPTTNDKLDRLQTLIADYNSVGITGVVDRNASNSGLELYRKLRADGRLTVRVAASRAVGNDPPVDEIRAEIRKVAQHPLRTGGDDRLRIIGIKMFLDGGMLTGSAYMRKPWGVSKIYSIIDPEYRGKLQIEPAKLLAIVRETAEQGLQFTAHSVGDGAVHNLLDAYAVVAKKLPLRRTRPTITHSNFMSKEAVEQAARLGVALDIQPAWLFMDTSTLTAHFGYDRLRYFQPLKSIFKAGGIAGGGSDHMQKIGSFRAVNPYNPFLGMWVTVTRRARWYEGRLHPEEALSREQALRFYTINNAYIMFLDDQVGSLEPGKYADFAVLDRDFLRCPENEIKDIEVLRTFVAGKEVYRRQG